jgi:hypothetical protein
MSLKQAGRTKILNLYRGINELKKAYHLRPHLVKDENDDLLADSQSNLNRWKNYFCYVFIVHGVNDVRNAYS